MMGTTPQQQGYGFGGMDIRALIQRLMQMRQQGGMRNAIDMYRGQRVSQPMSPGLYQQGGGSGATYGVSPTGEVILSGAQWTPGLPTLSQGGQPAPSYPSPSPEQFDQLRQRYGQRLSGVL